MAISCVLRAAAVVLFSAGVVLRAQDDFSELMRHGKEAMKQQQFQNAEVAFRGALALEPLSADALDALADAAYASGTRIQSTDPKDRFNGSSRFDEAKRLLEKAIGIDSNSFAAHYDLARIIASQCVGPLMQASLDEGAPKPRSGVLPYGPIRQNLRLKIGGLVEEGIQHANRALEIDPNSSAAMRQLSELLVIRVDLDETQEASETDKKASRDWLQKAGAAPISGVVRIGAQVAEANLIGRVDPVYPPLARAARVQGTVEFTITIDEQGHVIDVKLVRGHPLLVNAAKEAVAQWVYKPTLLNGQPVKVMTMVDVPFQLEQ